MANEFREECLHLLHSHLPEQAAFAKPRLDHLGRNHQVVPGSLPPFPTRDIDNQSILDGKMANDTVGVRQDGIVTGKRCEDIRFDPDPVRFVEQNGPQECRDGGDQKPVESVTLEKHRTSCCWGQFYNLPPNIIMIRIKISRVNVAEFRQKSTKGRKWEIRFIPGV